MSTISVGIDFGEYARRQRAGAKRGAQARKWMEAQTTNVLAEARNAATSPKRLEELAQNATAAVRTAVAGNPNTPTEVLYFLSTTDLITSEIAQKLSRNENTPTEALRNVWASTFATWFGNRDRILGHINWK